MYFQPEDNHERIIAKRGKFFKKLKVQTRVENDFSFSFLRETEEVEMLGKKMVGQAVIPGNFKRRYKRSPYDSGVLIY